MGHTTVRCKQPAPTFDDFVGDTASAAVIGADDEPGFGRPQAGMIADAGDDAWGFGGGDTPKLGGDSFQAGNSEW